MPPQQPEGFVPDGFVPDQPEKPSPSGPGWSAIALATGQKALPMISHGAAQFANNPEAWKTGRVLGELGGGIAGLMKAGPLGAGSGAYFGGKAGWRLSNMAQRGAGALANATRGPAQTMLNTLEPIMSPISIAQGGLGLSQLAEPKRQDIGFLGASTSSPQQMMGMSDAEYSKYNKEHPALLNELYQRLFGPKK